MLRLCHHASYTTVSWEIRDRITITLNLTLRVTIISIVRPRYLLRDL